jgi:tetratricopeptide (TPR) repeat protein
VYFGRAAATQPTEPAMVKQRDNSIYRHAKALLDAGRAAEAAVGFRRYVAAKPEDLDGKKGLLLAFRAAGMNDSASVIEAQLVNAATSDPAGGGLSESELFDIGAKQYNDKEYGPAAATFARIIAVNPNNRDALSALANTYLALNEGAKLAGTAEQLIAIEPLSHYAHSFRIQGYKLANDTDKLITAVVEREALQVDLAIDAFQRAPESATLIGKLSGREPRDENNKLIPVKAITILIEFLGEGGAVVTTGEAELPALKAGEMQPFSVTGKGAGIKFWRYRVK